MESESGLKDEIVYVIARGPVDAPIAVDVYGKTRRSAPLWARMCFDDGVALQKDQKQTRPQIVSRVYANKAPFDAAHRERFLQKAAGAIASAIEKASYSQISRKIADNDSPSVEDRLFRRLASYNLRRTIEPFVGNIDLVDDFKRLRYKDLVPLVEQAITEARDAVFGSGKESENLDGDDSTSQSAARQQAGDPRDPVDMHQILNVLARYEDFNPKHQQWVQAFSEEIFTDDFGSTLLREILSNASIYGIMPQAGETVWRARFVLTSRTSYTDLWHSFVQSDKEQFSIRRDQSSSINSDSTDTPHRRPPKFWIELWESEEISNPDAVPNSHVERSFSFSEIFSDYQFEHGVVFIHGIGPHRKRETLTRFGEPILTFWSKLLGAATDLIKRDADKRTGSLTYAEFRRKARASVLRNMVDRNGIDKTLDAFKKDQTQVPESGFVCGNMRVKDTVFDATDDNLPPCSLVRLSAIYHKLGKGSHHGGKSDSQISINESHIMMAEAHWTDKVISYSFDELFSWIFRAFPLVAASQYSVHARAIKNEIRQAFVPKKIPHRLLVAPLVIVPALYRFVMLFLAVLFVVLLQPVLVLLLILRLIPIPPVQSAVNTVVSILAGTVGQSQVLIQSPIRRNAIISSVTRDIDKILEYCERVTVVAHSQGAEVARIAAASRLWHRVSRWVTFGPGISPLTYLREDYNVATENSFDGHAPSKLLKGSLTTILRILFSLATVLLVLIGVELYFFGFEDSEYLLLLAELMVIYLAVVIGLTFVLYLRKLETPPDSSFDPEELGKTRNYYASHDPVPDGPVLVPKYQKQFLQTGNIYTESETINHRSVIKDHTSYFQNAEEFVAPVGSEIASMSRFLPGFLRRRNIRSSPPSFEQVQKRRWIKWVFTTVSIHIYAILLAGATYRVIDKEQYTAWWDAILNVWVNSEGFWSTTWAMLGAPLKLLLLDLSPFIAIAAAFVVVRYLTFRKWEQKNLDTLYKNLAREYLL